MIINIYKDVNKSQLARNFANIKNGNEEYMSPSERYKFTLPTDMNGKKQANTESMITKIIGVRSVNMPVSNST